MAGGVDVCGEGTAPDAVVGELTGRYPDAGDTGDVVGTFVAGFAVACVQPATEIVAETSRRRTTRWVGWRVGLGDTTGPDGGEVAAHPVGPPAPGLHRRR